MFLLMEGSVLVGRMEDKTSTNDMVSQVNQRKPSGGGDVWVSIHNRKEAAVRRGTTRPQHSEREQRVDGPACWKNRRGHRV